MVEANGEFYKGLSKIYSDLGILSSSLKHQAESHDFFEKSIKISLFYGDAKLAEETRSIRDKLLYPTIK